MNPDEYVQPIVLLREGTHEDAVRAVALASVRAWTDHPDEPGWAPWLAAAFVKTVRRAKPAQFDALLAGAAGAVLAEVRVGEAAALAYAPVRYAELARPISKLQVSGTDLPRAGWPAPTDGDDDRYVLVVNDSLAMSSGKTCAQVAHCLFALALSLHSTERAAALDHGVSVLGTDDDGFAALTPVALVVVTDAGRTEVKPSTSTSLACRVRDMRRVFTARAELEIGQRILLGNPENDV